MGITPKQNYRGGNYNGKELKELGSVQILSDAVNSDEAVRKSQSESIADAAAQDILVSLSGSASNQSAFTSSSMVGFLGNKQDNMEIDASSAAYLQIVDGYKIKATQLLITDVEVDEVYSSLQSFLDGTSPTKQQGDVVILTAASDNQERSWIKTGSASQTVSGYTRLQTDYNIVSIRAMFSVATYLTYDAASGQIGLDLGNGAGKLGAHTLPIDSNEFTSATGSNILAIAKSLEALILTGQTSSTQATAAVDNRFSSCSGVTGSDLGNFGGRFTNESSIKDVLVEAEQDLTDSQSDRAAIRSEFAAADSGLQANINSEISARISAVSSEASSRIANDNALSNSIATTNANLNAETVRATAAEDALDVRLDVVEGGASVNGSIAKAQSEAQAFASNAVSNEAIARQSGDAVLQSQIDAIADAFQYKGNVITGVRIDHIDNTDSNHDKVFANASFEKGDMYKMNIGGVITFLDSTEIEIYVGDSLVCISDAPLGNATAADFHVWDNSESSDLLREGQLNPLFLERVSNVISIVDDSIDRSKLDDSVEADIDSKVEKAGDTMSGALSINKTVLANDGYVGGYDFAAHVKQKSIDTASLTDTQRALLVENEVYTNGSGNPLDLDYANATTSASHYKGGSDDMTVATVGTHSEGSVTSSSAAVYATGAYGVATSTQLGVNSGGTFVAQNAATSNLGVFAFSDTAGALNNRAAYFALAPDSLDLDGYRVARVGNPLPIQDAAVVIDDYAGASHALYVNGKSTFVGKVIIPDSTADNEAVAMGEIKATEFSVTVTISANSNEVINHGLGTKKIMPTVWVGDELSTSGFDIERDTNSLTIYNATNEDVTAEILIKAFI